jgi:hypothetical protein
MYQETVQHYAEFSKAAADLKRAVGMIESWTAKAEDAKQRLIALEGGTANTVASTTEEPVTFNVPVTEEPVTP